jgi:glycosyltransferase involved in cell wall biosynthesis
VDLIVANSSAVAEDVVRRERVDPLRIRIIRNGVIVPPPPSDAERRAARAAMGVTDDGAVVGSVGTFKPGKGQARVLAAMAEIRNRRPDTWLVFVGDGPERAVVEGLARSAGFDHARFLGTVADARGLYPGFDVLVSASDAEGLPNVVLEAAAAGRPIVATAAGGTGEIVTDGQTGLLVQVGDTDGIAAAVVRVLDDSDLGNRLGRAARDHVTTAFGVERFVAETAALYEEMANHNAG